jgi:hypothetical protein
LYARFPPILEVLAEQFLGRRGQMDGADEIRTLEIELNRGVEKFARSREWSSPPVRTFQFPF